MHDPLKPTLLVQKTNTLVYDQGITYNETGITYNEVGVAYGGLYGNDDAYIMNIHVKTSEPRIDMFISIPVLPSILLENGSKLIFEDGGEILS